MHVEAKHPGQFFVGKGAHRNYTMGVRDFARSKPLEFCVHARDAVRDPES